MSAVPATRLLYSLIPAPLRRALAGRLRSLNPFAPRYCTWAWLAFRVVTEAVFLAAAFAFLPRLPAFAGLPFPCRAAVFAGAVLLSAWSLARLRIRRPR